MSTAFGRYTLSTKHICGCVLAIGGPVLALTGIVRPWLGLALIPVLYGAGAFAAPAPRRADRAPTAEPRAVGRSLDRLERRITGCVPYDVSVKTARIASAIKETLPRADALGRGSLARHVLVA